MTDTDVVQMNLVNYWPTYTTVRELARCVNDGVMSLGDAAARLHAFTASLIGAQGFLDLGRVDLTTVDFGSIIREEIEAES